MIHHLHFLKVLWNHRVDHFLWIWFALTASAAILIACMVRPRSSLVRDSAKRPLGHRRSSEAVLSIAALMLFLAIYTAGALAWEDFTYYDNSHFTNETLIGRNVPLQVSPEGGRFWPLGYQEFNVLRYVTHSISGYHMLRLIELFIVCAILLVLDRELNVPARVALIFLFLVAPSIVVSYSGLIYSEANLILALTCLAWCVSRFDQSHGPAWAVGAVLSAQIMLYYKETVFLLLVGFAGTRIVLRCRNATNRGWSFAGLRDPESRLDLCLISLSAVFILYYLAALVPHFGAGYAEGRKLPLSQVLSTYLALDLLVWIFALLCAVRLFLILRRRVMPSLFWDGLAVGGLCYLGGFLILRMESAYYLAPVDLIATLYIGRLTFRSLREFTTRAKLAATVVLLFVLAQELSFSAFRIYERKNVIRAKAELGHAINHVYVQDPQSVKRLFFPFAEPFSILEFASYLQYLGVPIQQRLNNGEIAGGVILTGESIQADGPCGYRSFVCHPGKTPSPGDLVIVFPDDIPVVNSSGLFRDISAKPLFSYSPSPRIPEWMLPLVGRLHFVSPIFAFRKLPTSWLRTSLSEWR